MGKQVNFYMHGSDEAAFLSAARERHTVHVLSYRSVAPAFEQLEPLPPAGPHLFQLWLWSSDVCSAPVVRWVAQQQYYVIDGSQSEVIEFSRSHERDGALIRGRIWAEMFGLKSNEATYERYEKSPAFEKWFDSLTRWIKKNYAKVSLFEYAGPGALEFQRSGGKFRQADFASTVKLVQH